MNDNKAKELLKLTYPVPDHRWLATIMEILKAQKMLCRGEFLNKLRVTYTSSCKILVCLHVCPGPLDKGVCRMSDMVICDKGFPKVLMSRNCALEIWAEEDVRFAEKCT